MSNITKEWIASKMKELMKHKSLDKIRVTEICSLAGIERATFYYHFIDKYDLVAYIFYKDAYKTDIVSIESTSNAMNNMKNDLIFYRRAYEDSSPYALWNYMYDYFVKRYKEIIKQKLNTKTLDAELEYNIKFYCMGAVGMTREWALNDNITPAETVVKMMFDSMPNKMKDILFDNKL